MSLQFKWAHRKGRVNGSKGTRQKGKKTGRVQGRGTYWGIGCGVVNMLG